MRPSTNHGAAAADNNRGLNGHVLNLHKRLYHALNLGNWENKEKWHSSDIEIQGLVLRSMDSFLDCISSQILQHPLVQDSVVDMLRTLKSILDFKSQSRLTLATRVSVKMVNILPSSMMQSHHLVDLIGPLVDLLASKELQAVMSCTTALNAILSKLSFRDERLVLEILNETQAVSYIVHNVKQSCIGDKTIEYFQVSASVLSKILLRWPSFRFSVWNDIEFLNILGAINFMSENSVKVVVLQLYSTLALCGNGAEKLLESGDELIHMMVRCMHISNSYSVRKEAYKLARCLTFTKTGCLKMMNISCEPFVKTMISALQTWISSSKNLDKSSMATVVEACRLASITRWAGGHHLYFWKAGVDRLLIDMILDGYQILHQKNDELSLNDLIVLVRDFFNKNLDISLRPYVWNILGGLSANCDENIHHGVHGNEFQLKVLIICACLSFMNSIGTSRQISENNPTNLAEGESAGTAVLMMVYSPCKYIASLARSITCELLKSSTKAYVEYLLHTLSARLSGNKFGLPGDLQIIVSLLSLACHGSLSKYRKLILENQGLKTLIDFIRWWINNPIYCKRASMVPHLGDPFFAKNCCFPSSQDWEGEDMLLLLSLIILVELLQHSSYVKVHPCDDNQSQLVQDLQDICENDCYSPGSKWYAAHALTYFGMWGFTSKLGKNIGKLLGDMEHSDLKLELVNENVVYVHEIILLVRCPSLLPPRESIAKELSSEFVAMNDLETKTTKGIRLSDQVAYEPLLKLLEYVYSGHTHAIDDVVKKLKIFAKRCKLEALQQMLSGIHPRWGGAPVPNFDLTLALGPAGVKLSDLILEVESPQSLHWNCDLCSSLVPHRHVHKVVLETSCDYLRCLLQSGMRESHSRTIKVPVSWEPLKKLVSWFYSDKLPKPTFNCSWNNMDLEVKCQEVESFIELCWLAEYWLIEDLKGECNEVAVSCLTNSRDLSIKMIQIAAKFSQYDLVQVAANSIAPSYHHLRNSGEFDTLDDNIVEMVRAASVRLSQESC